MVRPARLAELGIPMSQIARALSQRNAVQDGGPVDAGTSEARIRPQGLLARW